MNYTIDIVERPDQPAAVLHGHVDAPHIGEFLGRAFGEVAQVMGREHLAPAGAPFGRFEPTADGFEVEAGFPVDGPATADGEVAIVTLPGGPLAHTTHVGAYDRIGAAYSAVERWLAGHGYVASGAPWEVYLDGPEAAAPRTELFWPVRAAR